jgi:ATP-dependent Lon protease
MPVTHGGCINNSGIGLKTVVLPKRNERDLDNLPQEVLSALSIKTADRIDEVMAELFAPEHEYTLVNEESLMKIEI